MNEGLAATASAALSKKAKAAAKKDIRRALKPATAPVKKGLHKARKWFDKATSKVPVLGKFASLPLDVADDLVGGILPEVKSMRKKWQVPELVDKLARSSDPERVEALAREINLRNKHNQALTSNKMAVELNPGPPKGRKGKKKSAYRKKRAAKGPRPKGLTLRGLIKKAKVGRRTTRMKGMKFRNKKTGASSSGMRMSTSEYLWSTTLASGATNVGDEVLANGLLINPHELNLPELNIEVQRWELYRIKPHIKLEAISNGTVDCELFGYYDPDPTDTIPTDAIKRLQIAETHGGSPGYVSKGHSWSPNSNRVRASAAKWFYCDSAGTTGADIRQADQYRFRLLVKRAPRLYGYNGATASSGTVDLTINLRISFTIDFRNRTLDQIDNPAAGGMAPQSVYCPSSGLMSTTSMTGLAGSAAGSVYSIADSTGFRRPILVNNAGVNDTIYRPYTRKCPKYVVITGQATASTLSGVPSVGSDINLTSYHTGYSTAATAGNAGVWSYFYYVDNTETATSGTLSTATTVLGRWGIYGTGPRSVTYVASGPGALQYNWALNLGNWSAVTTPGSLILTICEFNEGNELAQLERHGPCTVEGIAFGKYKQLPFHKRPPWPEFLLQFQKDREEKKDEVTYWRSRALGNDFSRKEYKQESLSLTPNPSDDEDDWLAYQQQKAAMHKSPGIIGMRPLKIVQDDEKSERGAPRPKAGSQK